MWGGGRCGGCFLGETACSTAALGCGLDILGCDQFYTLYKYRHRCLICIYIYISYLLFGKKSNILHLS